MFNPEDDGELFASELSLITLLVSAGKERFLIHPLFEVFLKLKW